MIFQNPRTALNPIRPVGQQIADVLRAPRRRRRAREAPRARGRDAEQGAHPRSRAPRRGLSLRTVGRHVPARHDRDRARLRAGAADRRRADHRPRRHHPGRDHGPDRRAGARARAWRRSSSPTISALAAEYCDRIVVMHAGHIVEAAPAASCSPIRAIPIRPSCSPRRRARPASLAELASIPGGLPDLRRADLPACRYSGRCERRVDRLRTSRCRIATVGERHVVACWNPL